MTVARHRKRRAERRRAHALRLDNRKPTSGAEFVESPPTVKRGPSLKPPGARKVLRRIARLSRRRNRR